MMMEWFANWLQNKYNVPCGQQSPQRSIFWKGRHVSNIKQIRPSNTNRPSNSNRPNNAKSLEAANFKKGLETKIDKGNKGYDLLKKMGYQEGQGLGKDARGILQPLPLKIKSDRKGLGAEKSAPKTSGLKTTEPAPKTRRQRRALRRRAEKVDKSAMLKLASSQTNKAQQVAEKVPDVVNTLQVSKQQIKVEPQCTTDNEANRKNTRRKHSPIRAPDRSPPPLPVKPHKQSFLIEVDRFPSSYDLLDPKSLLTRFNSEIELMQLRLEAAASCNPIHGEDDLIVVKICIGKDRPIANHAFEYIRTELVGWIGIYQDQGRRTPIFHSMTNNERHITVVCDDTYAYKCLEHCIDDIAQMKTMGVVKLVRLPPISSLIYCVDAVYEGIARDADMFRSQIQMHKPKLNVDQWMTVWHEVCALERKTYFMFLIDERSALALNYQYSSSFCICMQKLVFRNRGIVAEEYLN